MSRIRILPEILSNKIAAGEVVERPASVVKELVENALDAGSTRILVEVTQGGKSIIRVSDDGSGMAHDDALLALERYATSKISTDHDLFDIRSLGFRGEAIPSIAAVSKFSITTRLKGEDSGTEIIVDGGKIKQVRDVGAPAGTMITAKQLFFNTPARRKFLKTVSTEMGHVADILAGIAMGRPNVQFKLVHNDRIVKQWSIAADPADRVADVLGGDVRSQLIDLTYRCPVFEVTGWLASPRTSRSTSRGIFTYVNGRGVRDRVLRHALIQGYSGRLMKGRFPIAVLFMTVPFDRVDVNVHPTKSEVRFADQKSIHDNLTRVVKETLDLADRPTVTGGLHTAQRGEHTAQSDWRTEPGGGRKIPDSERRADNDPWVYRVGKERPAIEEPIEAYPKKADSREHLDPQPESRDVTQTTQSSLWRTRPFAEARIIGQIFDTYIVCEADDGFLMVDQHAAHERIVYEHLKHRSSGDQAGSQKLLMPETLELGFREAETLDNLIPKLLEKGFDVAPFGGNTFVIKSVPAILSGRDVRPLLLEAVEKAVTLGFSTGIDRVFDQCLKLMACHDALRANHALNPVQIRRLLVDLDRCDNPSHCPHGRPTWVRWSKTDLEKAFRRIP